MKRITLLVATIALGLFTNVLVANAQEKGAGKIGKQEMKTDAAIRAVLDAQVAAWNRGDIRASWTAMRVPRQSSFFPATR